MQDLYALSTNVTVAMEKVDIELRFTVSDLRSPVSRLVAQHSRTADDLYALEVYTFTDSTLRQSTIPLQQHLTTAARTMLIFNRKLLELYDLFSDSSSNNSTDNNNNENTSYLDANLCITFHDGVWTFRKHDSTSWSVVLKENPADDNTSHALQVTTPLKQQCLPLRHLVFSSLYGLAGVMRGTLGIHDGTQAVNLHAWGCLSAREQKALAYTMQSRGGGHDNDNTARDSYYYYYKDAATGLIKYNTSTSENILAELHHALLDPSGGGGGNPETMFTAWNQSEEYTTAVRTLDKWLTKKAGRSSGVLSSYKAVEALDVFLGEFDGTNPQRGRRRRSEMKVNDDRRGRIGDGG